MTTRTRGALLLLLLLLTAPGCSAADDAVVELDTGRVRGVVTDEVRSFQGVPYAAPPVGALRWRAPEPVGAWSGVLDATAPGNRCPQVGTPYAPIKSDTEDCLVLNVTTPRAPASEPRPVMVWIHGDGAVGAGDFFDARRLATEGDVVVVTINYRLGVFGNFAYPGLEGGGTFGLQDQQLALRWVQRNAAAFGGDPDNVTLFGVSYGASATTAHLTSPTARGLFHRAIVQSGEATMDMLAGSLGPVPHDPWFMWATRDEQEASGVYVAEQLGCAEPESALECLRALPVQEILAVPSVMHIFQAYVIGDEILPEAPEDALRAGRFAAMPVLAGQTRDEHHFFVGFFHDLAGAPVTAAQYPELLSAAFGAQADAVAAEYPLASFASPGLAWAQVLSDRMWSLSTHEQNAWLAARAPVYFYEFAEVSAHDLPFAEELRTGALHADDSAYIFGDGSELTPARQRLSERMIRYWTNFARAGDPKGADLPDWPAFDPGAGAPHVQSLAAGEGGIGPVDFAAEHRLGFWSQLAE